MEIEYRNKSLTKIFGSPYLGCYALAVAIFSLGIIRDALYVLPSLPVVSTSYVPPLKRPGLMYDRYERALRAQPHYELLSNPFLQGIGWGLVATGQVLVVTSIYALGITGQLCHVMCSFEECELIIIGTYLGDYFGILMSSRVTGFPFNLFSDPMYVGSTFAFLGGAIL